MQELLCLGVNQYQYILCLIAGYFFCYQINVVGMYPPPPPHPPQLYNCASIKINNFISVLQ